MLAEPSAPDLLKEESASMVRRKAPAITALTTSAGDFLPLDFDVSPMDNSRPLKEGVSRTYKGYDGYAPMFAYLRKEGYRVDLVFREGSQHCQKGTPEFIRETLRHARSITNEKILVWLDSGNDSRDNFPGNEFENVEFIIKRNLRKEKLSAWLEPAKACGRERPCRSWKSNWIGKTDIRVDGRELPHTFVFKVSERTIVKRQLLAIPSCRI